MTQQSSLNPWITRTLFTLVAASMLYCIVLDVLLRSNSGLLQMMNIYATSEADLVQSAAGRNAAVHYDNFRTEDAGYAQTFYFLGNYAIWPRRLFPSDSPVVINTGFELLDQNFLPDDNWLASHDCAGVMTYFVIRTGAFLTFHAQFRPAGQNVWIQLR